MNDPREPVYRKVNGKYKMIGCISDPYLFEPWNKNGLWIHHRDENSRGQYFIADINELPCSAAMFGAVLSKKEELLKIITENRQGSYALAETILNWIAYQSKS